MDAQPQYSDETLRVALFSGNYNYVMDGPVRALNMLVGHLEKSGHDARVFAPTTKKPAFKHSGTLISVPSVAIPGKRSEYRLGLGLRGKVRRALDEFKPNLIHIAAPDYTGLQALHYAEVNGIPAVASFHTRFDTYPRYYKARWMEKYLTRYMRHFYGRCVHVYAPSQSMADELKADGIGRDVRLWTRGVDSELFSPAKRDLAWRQERGLTDDDIVVAFVGRLVLEKGIDVFVDALKKSQETSPNLRALIVGDGPERTSFESKLPDGVFTGYLQGADLARAYASADIFFNPSITETFGNVTLEAMASGLPSICAHAAGSKSLIDDGETGYLSAHSAAGFSEKLDALASVSGKRQEMGASARRKALAFAWDAVLDELIGHYYDAIDQNKRTRTSDSAGRLARESHAA